MKKLTLLTVTLITFMTSCHADRFEQIDAILIDQQEQINDLNADLETKANTLQSNIDTLSNNLDAASVDLSTRISDLNIYVDDQDQNVLDILNALIDDATDTIDDLDDRISTELEQLNMNLDITVEDINTIEANIIELNTELATTRGELSLELTSLLTSLNGDLLAEVADILREYLNIEYTQIVVDVSNDTPVVVPTGTTSGTVSGTSTETIVIVDVVDDLFTYANDADTTISNSSAAPNDIVITLGNGATETFTPNAGETQTEFTDRIKAWIDAN